MDIKIKLEKSSHPRLAGFALAQQIISYSSGLSLAMLLVFIAPAVSSALDVDHSAKIDEVARSQRWQALLYYEANGNLFKSRVTNERFFVDKKLGATDPAAELKAEVELLSREIPVDNNHPQCLYPSRYRFLKDHFQLQPPVRCPQYQTWLQEYQPEDLVFVYASQYISNPASVFGHSFFLLTSRKQTKGFWLTYNYAAAIPQKTSGFSYVWGGLTGWFTGDYSVMPLYNRLMQYASIENRDLWFYKIKLTAQELDFFLSHMWELVHAANFTYYFLNENCAAIMQRTFSAILPDMHDSGSHMYVEPIQVVKSLYRKGRIKNVDFVPAEGELLAAHIDGLDSEEEQVFREAIAHPDADLSKADAKSSEALVQYTAFQARKNGGQIQEKYKKLQRTAYIRRADFSDPAFVFQKDEVMPNAPHLARDSFSFDAGGSQVNGQGVADLSFSLGVHDLLDPDAGFLRNSSIEFLDVKVSADAHGIWLRDLIFANLESFRSYHFFDPNAAWRIKASIKENLLTRNETDQFFQLQTAFGGGLDRKRDYFYTVLRVDFNLGQNLPQDAIEAGPEIGAIYQWEDIKFNLAGSAGKGLIYFADSDYLLVKSGLSWAINGDFSLIQENEWMRLTRKDTEGYRLSLGLRSYF
jgi:hypothetical protein